MVPEVKEHQADWSAVADILEPGLRNASSDNNTVREVNFGELVGGEAKNAIADKNLTRNRSDVLLVVLHIWVILACENGQSVTVVSIHLEESCGEVL